MAKRFKKQDILYSNGNLFFLGGNTDNSKSTEGGIDIAGMAGSMGGLGSIVSGVSSVGDNLGQAIGGDAGAFTSGFFKPGSQLGLLNQEGVSTGAKILGMINPGLGAIISKHAKEKTNSFYNTNNDMRARNESLGIKANGGFITPLGINQNQSTMYNEGGMLNEFNSGGSHQANPNSGVQQGISPDGSPNLVEEGETKHRDYIFSDRLLIDKNTAAEHNFPKSMIGKTFAEASKRMNKLHKERPNDPITRDTVKSNLNHLMMANDAVREYEQGSMMAGGGHLYDGLSEDTGFLNFEDPRVLDRFINPNVPMNKLDYRGRLFGENLSKSATGLESDKLNTYSANMKQKGLDAKSKLNAGFFGDSKNLRYAPIAFNALAGSGLFGKSPAPDKHNPTLIQQQGNLSAPQIDEQTMRANIDAAYQNQIRGMSDVSGGSGAAIRAGLTGVGADYMSAVGQGFLGANTANNQAKMQTDQYNLGMAGNIAAQNAQMQNQASMYNTQMSNQNKALNYDNKMSYLGKAAEGVGDIGYEQRMMEIFPKTTGYTTMGDWAALEKAKKAGIIKAKGGKLGFNKWYQKTAKQLDLDPNPDSPMHQYDYRGYYSKYGDLDMTKGEHFTDEYKLPGHPTFSNESKYSNKKTPGGSWNQMDDKSWMFEHSPFTMNHYNETGKYLDGTGENQSLPEIIVRPNAKACGGRMKMLKRRK